MRARLLPLLILLFAGVLLALGFPLAMSMAATEQQRVVIDRIDDTTRFASLAQFVTVPPSGSSDPRRPSSERNERLSALTSELSRYHQLYGIRAGVFYRDGTVMAASPGDWRLPEQGEGTQAFNEALAGRRSQDPAQVWPWQDRRIAVASPVVRDGDVVAVVLTDSPTDQLRSQILRHWLPLALGEAFAMLCAVGAAVQLTRWVLRPVGVLDKAAHDIATDQLAARVVASEGPPELRRLARSFNEMAGHVEEIMEQQRAFVADASHQLRNPLAALLLRIELLGLELPPGSEEFASVEAEGKRLARVLDDLLGLALAEHSRPDLRLTDVGALAAERVDAWRVLAEQRDITLRTSGNSAVTAWVDPVGLSSALDAVVDNALKFTPAGETVTVSVSPEREQVTIVVADGGPGLTEDELARVGDRFWRSGRHQNVKGSGLGLSITKALLAAGGGTLAVEPNRPHGLRVVLVVPRNSS
ncbi:HAMP domain-containing histidine kinase [Streptomyces sp. XM4193]|uniref:sensor histidine kinase n=1 Tax=Streptomyces sp. XM4193 TaxID=2929782 RepID=UPI001FFBED24|nr:HAMP domain-containing sensor histidine kinase [Streptomyces sp. XM4193]MCK1798758.1 HAMP domain-containing histidine kinase [Streptomyces sp. XM4193]